MRPWGRSTAWPSSSSGIRWLNTEPGLGGGGVSNLWFLAISKFFLSSPNTTIVNLLDLPEVLNFLQFKILLTKYCVQKLRF
jgi:hypothetical protein